MVLNQPPLSSNLMSLDDQDRGLLSSQCEPIDNHQSQVIACRLMNGVLISRLAAIFI